MSDGSSDGDNSTGHSSLEEVRTLPEQDERQFVTKRRNRATKVNPYIPNEEQFINSRRLRLNADINHFQDRHGAVEYLHGINEHGLIDNARLGGPIPDEIQNMFHIDSNQHANFLIASALSRDMDLTELTPKFIKKIKKDESTIMQSFFNFSKIKIPSVAYLKKNGIIWIGTQY
jgi:hypothetical protein